MKKTKLNHVAPHIFSLTNSLRRYMDNYFYSLNLTGPQSRMLNYIYERSREGKVYQRNLEEMFNIRRSTVTSSLQSLENLGYIERINCNNDARSKEIIITEKGVEINKECKMVIDSCEEIIKNALDKEEITLLVNLCDRLRNCFDCKEDVND